MSLILIFDFGSSLCYSYLALEGKLFFEGGGDVTA